MSELDRLMQEIKQDDLDILADIAYQNEQAMREELTEPTTNDSIQNTNNKWAYSHIAHCLDLCSNHCNHNWIPMSTQTPTKEDVRDYNGLHQTVYGQYIKHWPKTGAARYWIERYNNWELYEDQVKYVNIYEIWQCYGGPEEGGWWYEAGAPIQCHNVFSKKQAIRRAIEVSKEYEYDYQPRIDDSRNNHAWYICFDSNAAESYPDQRPHYC